MDEAERRFNLRNHIRSLAGVTLWPHDPKGENGLFTHLRLATKCVRGIGGFATDRENFYTKRWEAFKVEPGFSTTLDSSSGSGAGCRCQRAENRDVLTAFRATSPLPARSPPFMRPAVLGRPPVGNGPEAYTDPTT